MRFSSNPLLVIASLDAPFLKNLRVNRYGADDQAIDVSSIHGDDLTVIRNLYAALGELEWLAGEDPQNNDTAKLDAFVALHDPASLHGSYSTTGSGHGLHIVARLVGHAYGVVSHNTLVREGYVGARVIEDTFATWFHWPLARG